MSQLHLVNVWADPQPGPGGFNPMPASMLWLPDGHQVGYPAPAFIYSMRWGGYPYDPLPASLGPQLADRGYAMLSVCFRRRGMEGQLSALPDNDLTDLKLAIDYLSCNGFVKIFLVGEELGGNSIVRYMAKHKDSRVSGLAWFNPVSSPADWLREKVGADKYAATAEYAAIAARQGAGMDVRIDLVADKDFAIAQNALPFLSWWGPAADTRLDRMMPALAAPVLALAETEASPALRQELSSAQFVTADTSSFGDKLAKWAADAGASLLRMPSMELVAIDSPTRLTGLFWSPADGAGGKTATLLIHGLTSSPLSPLFLKMAPVLAQTGTAVLAPEMRRSGWAGHETSVLDNDLIDIEAWVSFLLERGYEKIVLAGASIGSISVGRYQSVKPHPNVVAIAHLMPTADCPEWFRAAAGEGPYLAAVEQADAAIDAGRGEAELIDVDIRQPPPNKYGGRFRWTQRAASWLSWWGPDADSRNTVHIANAGVPLLLLSGTDDSYNDEARFAELKAAAVNAPSIAEIWYPGIDHGLAGVETRVATDLHAWLQSVGAV
ncbi:MAG: alpha/beta hydrolase [Gammaproteobacteria bacterium]